MPSGETMSSGSSGTTGSVVGSVRAESAGSGKQGHWAVVGGGMLGLATAWRLSQQGYKVTLLEAAPELGGLTSAWSLGNTTWDRFYHVTLLSDTRLRAILDEIGLEKEIRWVQTRTGFFSGGKLYSLSSSIDFLKFPPLSLWQKFRLGSTIFYASKLRDWKALERIRSTSGCAN